MSQDGFCLTVLVIEEKNEGVLKEELDVIFAHYLILFELEDSSVAYEDDFAESFDWMFQVFVVEERKPSPEQS